MCGLKASKRAKRLCRISDYSCSVSCLMCECVSVFVRDSILFETKIYVEEYRERKTTINRAKK
jgi:hypothetical protein